MSRNFKSQPREVKAFYTSANNPHPTSPSNAINPFPIPPPPPYPPPPPPSYETTSQCDPKSGLGLTPTSPPSSNTTTHPANPIKPKLPPAPQPCPCPISAHSHLGSKPRPIPPALPPLFPPRPPPKTKSHVLHCPLPEILIHKSPPNTPEPESPPKDTCSPETLSTCQSLLEQYLLHSFKSSKAEQEVSIIDQEVGDSCAKKIKVDNRCEDAGGLHHLCLRGGGDDEDGGQIEIVQTPQLGQQLGDHPISPATGFSQDQREQRSQGWGTQPSQSNQQDQSTQRRQRGHRSPRHSAQPTSSAHQEDSTHVTQVFPRPPVPPVNPNNVSGGSIVHFYDHPLLGHTSVVLPEWDNPPVVYQDATSYVVSPYSSAQFAGVPVPGQSPNLTTSPHLVHGPAYTPLFVENNPPSQSGSAASRPLNPQAPGFVPQHTVPGLPHWPLAAFDRYDGPQGSTGAMMFFQPGIIVGHDVENKRLKSDVRRLELENEAADEQLRRLQTHLTVVEGIKAMERAESDRLREQSRKIRREQERLQREIKELQAQLMTVSSERNKLKGENTELERQLNDSRVWKEHWQRVVDSYVGVSEDWETEKKSLGSKIKLLQTKVDDLKAGVRRNEVGDASILGLEEAYEPLAPDGELESSSADSIQVVERSRDLGNSHRLCLRGGGGDEVEGNFDSVPGPHDRDRSVLQEPQGEGGQKWKRSHPDMDGQQVLEYPGHQMVRPGQPGQSRYSSSMLQPVHYTTMQSGPLISHNSSAQNHPTAAFTYSVYSVNQQPVQMVVANPYSTNPSGIHQRFPPIVSGLSEHDLTIGAYRGQSSQLAPIQSLEPDSSVVLPSIDLQPPGIHTYNWKSSISTPYYQPHSSLYVLPEQQAARHGRQEHKPNEEILDDSREKQRLLHSIHKWRSAHEKLAGNNEKLTRENTEMKVRQLALAAKQRTSSNENQWLKGDNAKMKDRQWDLEEDLLELRNDNERLQHEIGRLRHEAGILRLEADELKTKLGILKSSIGKRAEIMPELSGNSQVSESHRMQMRGGGDDVDKAQDQQTQIPVLQSLNRPVTPGVRGGRFWRGEIAQMGNSVSSINRASPKSPGQVLNLGVSSDAFNALQGPQLLQEQRNQKDMREKRGHSAENDQARGGQQAQKRQRCQDGPPPCLPSHSGRTVGTQQPVQTPHTPFAPSAGPHTFIFFTDSTANYFGLNPQPLRITINPPFIPRGPGPHAFTFFPDGTAHYFGCTPAPLSMAFSPSSWDGVPVMYQISPPVVSNLPFTDVSSPNLVVGRYHGQVPQSASFSDFNPQPGTAYCTPYRSLKWRSAEDDLRKCEVLERRIRDQATLKEMSERYRRLQQGVVHLKAQNDNMVPDDMELFAESADIGNQLEILREDLVTAKRDNAKLQKRRGIADFDRADVEDELRISRYEVKKRLGTELHPLEEQS